MVRGSRPYAAGAALLAALAAGILTATPASAAVPADPATGVLVINAVTTSTDATPEFSYAITCTGDGGVFERTAVVPTTAGAGTATITGLPLDSACLVTETAPAGWRVTSANPQAFVPSADGTTTEFAHLPRKHTAATPRPPLRLVGRTDKGSAAAGEIVGYSIDVTNTGPRTDGVTITDAIPANTEYVAGSAVCLAPCRAAYDSATNTLIWRIPSLAAGRSSALSFRVRVLALTPRPDGSLPGTVLLNSAVGSASQTTATTSNEVRTVVLAVLGTKTVKQGRHIARGAPQRPALPVTGSRTGELLPVALLLIAAGSALLLGERRYTARGLRR